MIQLTARSTISSHQKRLQLVRGRGPSGASPPSMPSTRHGGRPVEPWPCCGEPRLRRRRRPAQPLSCLGASSRGAASVPAISPPHSSRLPPILVRSPVRRTGGHLPLDPALHAPLPAPDRASRVQRSVLGAETYGPARK